MTTPEAPNQIMVSWTGQGKAVASAPISAGEVKAVPATEYIRRDPAVLAALPEVQALVAAERERCAKIAMDRWAAHRESADRTFELDYEGARESAVSRETRADEARAIAAAIREGRG